MLAVVAATVVAFLIGMDGDGDDTASQDRPGASDSTGASPSGEQPSAEGMESFIRTYIETAVSDPAQGFAMLTPAYQDESKGLAGYESFWGEVKKAEVLQVSGDPDSLVVEYTYRYWRPGVTTEDVRLKLSFESGTYLIAGEA